MTGIDVFTYGDQPVRTVLVDGEPWFVAGDVAGVLGYSATAAMTRSMDDDEKGVQILHTPGGDQQVTVISEPGLYDAILRSRVPGAQQFKRWIKHEVLPTIRQSGSYAVQPRHSLPQTYAEALRELADTAERAEAAEREVAVLAPPAAAWDELASGTGDYTVSDAAKILARGGVCTGPRKLYAYLCDDVGWVFRRAGRWQAMQSAINAGYVVERITGGYFDDITGERKQGDPQVRITAKGIEKLFALMRAPRTLAVVNQ